MRHWYAIVCLTCCIAVGAAPAVADVVVLTNGVEVRNARIVNETEHVVMLQIIGSTKLVLGKSEIDRIEREPAVPAEPGRPRPEPARQPVQPVTAGRAGADVRADNRADRAQCEADTQSRYPTAGRYPRVSARHFPRNRFELYDLSERFA